jgi:antitoxin Phd
MSKQWQLQDAKNRLSRLVEEAKSSGPQTITVRGKPTVVVLSVHDYQKLRHRPQKLSAFFAQSPLKGVEIDLTRSQELPRAIEL